MFVLFRCMHTRTRVRTHRTTLMLVLLASHDDYNAADAIDKKKQVPVCVSATRGITME